MLGLGARLWPGKEGNWARRQAGNPFGGYDAISIIVWSIIEQRFKKGIFEGKK